MDFKDELDEVKQTLATERDELKVRAHLFTLEAAEEWEVLEKKWEKFELKSGRVAEAGKEGLSEIVEATKLLGSEIMEAYKRLRHSL